MNEKTRRERWRGQRLRRTVEEKKRRRRREEERTVDVKNYHVRR